VAYQSADPFFLRELTQHVASLSPPQQARLQFDEAELYQALKQRGDWKAALNLRLAVLGPRVGDRVRDEQRELQRRQAVAATMQRV